MAEVNFDLDGGALCLDFANTVEWHDSDQPEDNLAGYADLIAWGRAAGILEPQQAARLSQFAASHPEKAAVAFSRAVRLREAIFHIFSALAVGLEIETADLDTLNEALSLALSHLQIIAADRQFDWDWRQEEGDIDQVFWAVARSAGDLLISDQLDRVGQCADDRGCGYLFVDTSRNKSRRWCSMDTCGNRAKARRHYREAHKSGS